jgi:RsiW-degrading membrane proteinase PrsW (M82 family)
MSDKLKSALKWGVIGSAASAVLGLLFFILNVASDSSLKYVSFAFMIGLIISLPASAALKKEKPEELIIEEKLSE